MDPTNRITALASALVEELARCGVRRAAVSPGSRSTPLAVALWRQPAIEVDVILDERSAGFFALGCALATRTPAVALCTSGTAAANLHPAVVEADEASVPLIVLTADRPPELRGVGAGQAIDQLKLYGDAVRWFCQLATRGADDHGLLHFRSVACRAYAAAAGDPKAGPVHLNVPWREPLAPIAIEGDVSATDPLALEGRGERPLQAVARSLAGPEAALMDEFAERIASATRGLIVAGRQLDPELAEPVAALAEATGYPVLAEPTSQLRWGPHTAPCVISTYDFIARDFPGDLEPELIIRFGDMPTSKPLRQWLTGIAGLRQIVVEPAADWREPTRRAETIVRAEPSGLAIGLAERLKAGAGARRAASTEAGDGPWADRWRDADRRIGEAIRAVIEAGPESSDASEPGVWPALAARLTDGDLVFAASSMPIRDQEGFLPPGRAQVRFLANRGANGIDGSISTAAGASAASGARAWAVIGDLALAHDIGGLAALRAAPRLRLVVLDNGGGGIFHFLPQADAMSEQEFEALLGTPSGLDAVKAAELYGLDATVAETSAELAGALAGEARMIVVKLDRRANVDLHRRLEEIARRSFRP